jgi:hypothetical protein
LGGSAAAGEGEGDGEGELSFPVKMLPILWNIFSLFEFPARHKRITKETATRRGLNIVTVRQGACMPRQTATARAKALRNLSTTAVQIQEDHMCLPKGSLLNVQNTFSG